MESAQYILPPCPDGSRSRKAASCQVSYCPLLGESHQGLEGRLEAGSDSSHTSGQVLDTEMGKGPLRSRWAECRWSCGLEWGPETWHVFATGYSPPQRATPDSWLPQTDPDGKKLGGVISFTDTGTQS